MANKYIQEKFSKFARGVKQLLLVVGLAVLAACSSSSDGADVALTKEQMAKLDSERVSLKTSLAKMYPNGQMTAEQELASKKLLQQNPAVLKMSGLEATRGVVPQVATSATFMPVYRVQNTTLSGSYFFSIWETEKNAALAANPSWRYEGPAFYASQTEHAGLSPVWRFRNKINGSYLFTIYEGERASIASTYADTFEYEGVAWHASQTEASGYQPLYRFRNLTNGTYLFSAYDSEKRDIIANFPGIFEYEGVSYYVKLSAVSDRPVDTVITNQLTVTTVLQAGVLEVSPTDAVNWSVLTTTTDEDGMSWPTSVSAPTTAVLTTGQVFILNEKAMKVVAVSSDGLGKQIITTTKPGAKEIFSVFKLDGNIPLYPFTVGSTVTSPAAAGVFTPLSGILKQAGAAEKITVSNLISTPGKLASGEYKPDIDGTDCLDIRVGFPLDDDEEGPFLNYGQRIYPIGMTMVMDKCNVLEVKQGTSGKVLGLNAVVGLYPDINLHGADLLDPNSLANASYDAYMRFNADAEIGVSQDWSRIFRLFGKRAYIPGAYGLTFVGMLDLILKGEAEGALKAGIKKDFAFGKRPAGSIYMTQLEHNSPNKKDLDWSGSVSAKVSAQSRVGFGIGAFEWSIATINPRAGIEMEWTAGVPIQTCSTYGVYSIGGADLIAMPNFKHYGDIKDEMKRTLDMGTYRFATQRAPDPCLGSIARITRYMPDATPPLSPDQPVTSSYKLKGNAEFDFSQQGGDILDGASSTNATTYKWEVLSGATVLANYNAIRAQFKYDALGFGGAGVTVPVGSGMPVFTVSPGHTVRLTVADKNGVLGTPQSIVILGNQGPVAVGIAQEQTGSRISISPTGSLDTDGKIVKAQWKNSSGVVVAETAGLQAVTINRSLLAGQRPAQLQLTVYDNDGASNTTSVTEILIPSATVTNITPTTATLNTATVFTVTGTNLPLTAILAVADATCLDPVSNATTGLSTGFTQTCTPLLAGVKSIIVKTSSGGTFIDTSRTVNVTAAPVSGNIELPATSYLRGTNVALSTAETNGADTLMNAPPYTSASNTAEWDFTVPTTGSYELFATYAANLSRPVTISFNGTVAFANAMAEVTGGWVPANRQTLSQGVVQLTAGTKTMRVARGDVFPHIKGFTLVPVGSSVGLLNPANGHRYEVITCGAWSQCDTAAKAKGGNLATIRNSAENSWIVSNLLQQANNVYGLWIGATDKVQEGAFKWSSGETFAYSNWNTNEPNNGSGSSSASENFVHILKGNGWEGRWNDFPENGESLVTQAIVEYSNSGTLSVRANLPTGTEFTIPAGVTSCTFTAPGVWSYGAGGATTTANGSGATYVTSGETWYSLTSPAFSLIANLPFGPLFIGANLTTSVQSGQTWAFKMNDAIGWFPDNTGALTVSYNCN